MAKLCIWNLVTLDGYFEGEKKWDIQFHERAWGPELSILSKDWGTATEALVFGRITYEGMKAYWTTAEEDEDITTFMNDTPKLVASRTITASDWKNTTVTADIIGDLRRLKQTATKPIRIFGSAELCDSLLKAGLVDEIMIGVAPVLLGRGTPFFRPGRDTTALRLQSSMTTAGGSVVLTYAIETTEAA
ncbi:MULTISPECIES: dihydrofolate reductase family protein [unclassified Rhizobium]|uniref:dihydrofolate reductase family protein n=1 Tax=unclassified Rhizobium TaxID=2613769 RepID=UPI0007144765|nr:MULTISPECIES: dihydrofolate reductase family protein [unclassified Rhizobium]KQS95871.1 riboflavin biosynthesis protein RibD [Rhizobium sp. Leaf386]KQU10055.1 riboflavin biosynthesis protein RibD [Rhizobium sp. Leaf453]